MTTAPTPEEVRALADACACDWHAVRPHLVVDALRRLQAENERLRAELEARKPLTLSDEQIDAIGDKCGKPSATWHYEFARAIERRITGGSS